MGIYIKNPSIGWQDDEHTTVKATWQSPYTGTNWFEAELYLKEYKLIWECCYFLAGWTVTKTETVPIDHAALPNFYTATYKPPENEGVTSVRCSICPVPDSSLNECTRNRVYGAWGSCTWPDYYRYLQMDGLFGPPDYSSAPNVEIDTDKTGLSLKASVSNYSGLGDIFMTFQIKYDGNSLYRNVTVPYNKNEKLAEAKVTLLPGHKYKVRVRPCFSANGNYNAFTAKNWSPYSSEVLTRPDTPKKLTQLCAEPTLESPNLIKVVIQEVPTATKYGIEWTKDKKYFDTGANVESAETPENSNTAYINPGSGGSRYYVRVRAINGSGQSEWYLSPKTIVIGKEPVAPTTWTLTSTFVGGPSKDAVFYWTHNSQDGSTQRAAIIHLNINGTERDIEWPGVDYSPSSTYKEGDYVKYNGGIYRCKQDISVPEVWTPGHWQYIGDGIENDDVYFYRLNLGSLAEVNGAVIKWKVKTKGVMDTGGESGDGYSKWSTEREVKVYAQPEVSLLFKPNISGMYARMVGRYGIDIAPEIAESLQVTTEEAIELIMSNNVDYYLFTTVLDEAIADYNLEHQNEQPLELPSNTIFSYPINLECTNGPSVQNPMSYTFKIISASSYDTEGFDGETQSVVAGQVLCTKYGTFPDSQIENPHDFMINIKASDVHLENGMDYIFSITIGMDSGLTATNDSLRLTTSFEGQNVLLAARVSYDTDSYIAYINPVGYSMDKPLIERQPQLADNLTLAVYRREYNGEYTLIEEDIYNSGSITVTDPHPSLNKGMYRIVSTDTTTGNIDFQDVNSDGIQDPCIIIQWNEKVKSLSDMPIVTDPLSDPLYGGSIVRLPFNIKTSENNSIDVEHINYIGRKRPVPYFGTQLGESATLNCEIDKDDEETLFQLRRLAIYMGEVYVREPSGMGYWATVAVSFDRSYDSLVIPVTINVTRVEGDGRA